MIKRYLIIVLIFLCLVFTPKLSSAQDIPEDEVAFATSYDVTYDIGIDGVATVTEKVALRNLTSRYYATQFSLTIGATQISDVTASDDSGPLTVTQEKKDTSTTINVKFNQQVAGEGKTLPWTLKFKSKDFATPLGKVWEVSIPKVVSTTNLETYNVTISIPSAFGQPTLISPTPKTQTSSFDRLFLTYDKERLKDTGVSANFGQLQLFDFDLIYHLENPSIVPGITSIALPPDTAYQDVVFQRIDPKPANVTVDDDGNFLAWYRLTRGQKMDIKVVGSAKLYASSKEKKPTLPNELRKTYTSAVKYWEKDNQVIQTNLAEILGTNLPAGRQDPPKNTYEKAKLIHRFVVNSLKYDSSRLSGTSIERFGAVTALNNPNTAVCMEFTDLFIALTRAAGIPARELDGFAYTANPDLRPLSLSRDILHAWPEFFDEEKGWVMIDPTWENTTNGVDYFNKLDLNHFVFAIKGTSSEDPAPAGSYKFTGQESQDVKVTFSENDFLGKPQLNVKVEAAEPILAGFPGKIKVVVTNVGNSVQSSSISDISSERLTVLDGKHVKVTPIPAFGHTEFEFNIRTKNLVENYDDLIKVTIAGQEFTQQVKIRPIFLFQHFPYVLFVVLGVIFAVYFAILGGLLYKRRLLLAKKPVTEK